MCFGVLQGHCLGSNVRRTNGQSRSESARREVCALGGQHCAAQGGSPVRASCYGYSDAVEMVGCMSD